MRVRGFHPPPSTLSIRYTIQAFEKKGEDEIKKDPTSQSDWGFGRTVTIMKAKVSGGRWRMAATHVYEGQGLYFY